MQDITKWSERGSENASFLRFGGAKPSHPLTYPQVSLIGPDKAEVHTPRLMLRGRNPQKLIAPRRFSAA